MLAAAPGVRTLISGDESMVMTHMLRAIHDAIVVGVGTVLADNPRLNCRLKDHERAQVDAALERKGLQVPQQEDRSPTAVVLDPKLRTPEDSKFIRQPHCMELKRLPFVFYAAGNAQIDEECMKALSGLVRLKSIACAACESRDGERASQLLSLSTVMKELRYQKVSSVMVEGGATVLSSFLKSDLCDLVIITIAPTLFGTGLSMVSRSNRVSFATTRLANPKWVQCGEDIVLVGAPK